MHIGFDISQTGSGKAGCGYFAHALVESLVGKAPDSRFSLYPSFGDFYFDPRMPLTNPYKGRRVSYGPRHLSREIAANFWNLPDVESSLGNPDIIHSNNFWCPLQLRSSRLVYTLYDIGFTVEPAWTTEANRTGCFNGVFLSSLAADLVVAISEASRDHYLNIFPHFPVDRVRVVYPCSRFFNSNRTGSCPQALAGVQEGGFWLTVGTIEPRKNQRQLAEVYARYRALGGPPLPLVFAGGKGWLMDDFYAHLEQLGITGDVIMTGYVSDDELIWLYRNCYGNLYPSLFEGFGLPVLEGMQFGAPTLTSNTSSIPEVAGEAALLLAPDDTEGWARGMLRLTENRGERDHLSDLSKKRAAVFNWEHSAVQLLELYKETLRSPKRQGLNV